MKDNTTKYVGLEDVIVKNITEDDNVKYFDIEMPRRVHHCPSCGHKTDRIHDYRTQRIKDLPSFGKHTFLLLRKRRYVCVHCGKRFYEDIPFLPRYHRMTSRMVADIINSFRKLNPASQIAEEHNISSSTAFRCFDYVNYQNKSLPYVLSIDEFKGNAGGEKYQSIITDPKNKKILDILPNRYESDLIRYFKSFNNRNNVRFFVTDMNPHFKRVARACFPDATIIADRYHITRQVIWAMEKVRKNEQKKLPASIRKYFKRSKSLLNKKLDKMSQQEKHSLANMLELAPRLARAYDLKNRFLKIMHSPNSQVGRRLLSHWLLLAQVDDLPEFEDCVTAYSNWSQEILNALDYPWSNGFTEGCNNKTKVLKRVCFGVSKFSRFRNRILHCSS